MSSSAGSRWISSRLVSQKTASKSSAGPEKHDAITLKARNATTCGVRQMDDHSNRKQTNAIGRSVPLASPMCTHWVCWLSPPTPPAASFSSVRLSPISMWRLFCWRVECGGSSLCLIPRRGCPRSLDRGCTRFMDRGGAGFMDRGRSGLVVRWRSRISRRASGR